MATHTEPWPMYGLLMATHTEPWPMYGLEQWYKGTLCIILYTVH